MAKVAFHEMNKKEHAKYCNERKDWTVQEKSASGYLVIKAKLLLGTIKRLKCDIKRQQHEHLLNVVSKLRLLHVLPLTKITFAA